MNLKTATEETQSVIWGKQDPDEVNYIKQWDELGRLKGWIVNITWGSKIITLDMTSHYTRVLGDIESIPEYIKGKHQRI